MLLIVLFIILFPLITFLFNKGIDDIGFSVFMSILATPLLSFIICVIVFAATYTQKTKVETLDIVAIRDDTSLQGQFSSGIFVGLGYIDMKRVYIFKYKLVDGGVREGHCDAESSTIYETDKDAQSRVETITEYKVSNYVNIGVQHISKVYKIYVPKNTVVKEFSIK